ncbi:hypothetical protein BG004_007321 [Podila humilis]|nr:hypothetical protein BG004_007321 [Podila humilis]
MNEILSVLVTHTSQGTIRLDSLPPFLAPFRTKGDIRGDVAATADSLRKRYHALQAQEYQLVLANVEGADVEQFLAGIRRISQEIENVIHTFHAEGVAPKTVPRFLVSCYFKQRGAVNLPLLQQRYEVLKEQEFQIGLADMKNAAHQSTAPSSLTVNSTLLHPHSQPPPSSVMATPSFSYSTHSIQSLAVDMAPTTVDLPPSFAESQSVYR